MRVLHEGPGWVAFFKPAGFHVHPPENPSLRIPRDKIFLYHARDFVGQHVYPVHRLDAPTCGVLLMALNPPTASRLAQMFQNRAVRKTYHAVVRGWSPESGTVDAILDENFAGDAITSITHFRRQGRIEIPEPVGRRHGSARYSFLEVEPETGRFHQIRRHLNRISHPVVGDTMHGDSHHNRFFRQRLGFGGLCLKAQRLRFTDEGRDCDITSPLDEKWEGLQKLFAGEFKV